MRIARAVGRMALALLHVLHGVFICAAVFPFLDGPRRLQRVGWWSARLLALLGITVVTRGTPRGGATLVVANHVSWLDILALNAVQPARFVSKADVRHWPVIGWLVACGGTLFIERERKRDAMKVVHQVADALNHGHTIAVFPEGTTSDGHGLLPFHANMLQAAIATEAPIQPVALRFCDARDSVSRAAAYVGDTDLVSSVWQVVCAADMRVTLQWMPAIESRHGDRRALAGLLRDQILAALNVTE